MLWYLERLYYDSLSSVCVLYVWCTTVTHCFKFTSICIRYYNLHSCHQRKPLLVSHGYHSSNSPRIPQTLTRLRTRPKIKVLFTETLLGRTTRDCII